MICITIQRTLSVAKVRYLKQNKECFKIFYPRFFAWVNLFLLNHILLYSLLFPFQSIQTYVAMVSVFWMVYFVCIFSSFRVFCIKVSRRRRKTVLIPQTNFLRLWHGKKNPWRYALKYFKTILPRTFLCLPCWQRLTFIATTRSSIFIAQSKNFREVSIFICRSDFLSSTRSFLLASTVIVKVQRYGSGLWKYSATFVSSVKNTNSL